MPVASTLTELGLSPNEVKIYLTMLDVGMAPISIISRRAGLKRPTTYGVVKKLRKRGLTDCFLSKGVRLYSVISPKALYQRYAEHLQAFERALPELAIKHEQLVIKPKVSFFEGKRELERLYRDAFTGKGELLAYLLPEQAERYFSKEWLGETYKRSAGHSKKRIVSVDTAEARALILSLSLPATQTRFTAENQAWSHELLIRDQHVYIFSFREGFALHLVSADAASMQKILFESTWQRCITTFVKS